MTHIAFSQTDHRPWNFPTRPWRWRQSWCDLLFAHWPIPASSLRPLVPGPLTVQEFDGTSWIGIVPFLMKGVMHRPLPDLPWISSFPELNVRIYVEYEGKPGVWFLSLDAQNPFAVWAARKYFYLPYFHAGMSIEKEAGRYHYSSQRTSNNSVYFKGSYRPTSDSYQSQKGSLEYWLTERYCLYARSPDGNLYRSEVHHLPWPLQKADAEFQEINLLSPFNLNLPDARPLLHFASNIDVVIWPAEKLKT